MNATQTATTRIEVINSTKTTSSMPPDVSHIASTVGTQPEATVSPPIQSKSNLNAPTAAQFIGQSRRQGLWQVASRKRYVLLAPVVLVGSALLVFLGWSYLVHARSWVKTDNAYLATHIHSISSRVAGTVDEVLIDENQTVAAGQTLARLDRREFEVHRQEALAQVAQARAQVQEARARIAQAQAQVAREQARAIKAKGDLVRAGSLFEGGSGAISKQELELARAESDAGEAALRGAHSALDSVTASAAAAEAQAQVADTTLANAELQLSYAEIVAPASGCIGKKSLEVGNRVQPGQALLALMQTDIWVNANFKETQLAHLQPGQTTVVRVDAFPGRESRELWRACRRVVGLNLRFCHRTMRPGISRKLSSVFQSRSCSIGQA
jgi:membrane fusion protein (multidrug efflux system)